MGIHKLSIQDVHEKTGLNRATVSNLYHEKVNRIDFETMEKICKLFKIGPGELFEVIQDDENK